MNKIQPRRPEQKPITYGIIKFSTVRAPEIVDTFQYLWFAKVNLALLTFLYPYNGFDIVEL